MAIENAYEVPQETARTYRGYQDFTDPMLRAAAGEVVHNGDGGRGRADSLRWMGYADQELTRLRQLLDLDGQPGYAQGRPQYAASVPSRPDERSP